MNTDASAQVDLPVPNESIRAVLALLYEPPAREDDGGVLLDVVESHVQAIAAPVVAAWARAVAAGWHDQQWSTTPRAMGRELVTLADELDGAGATRQDGDQQ